MPTYPVSVYMRFPYDINGILGLKVAADGVTFTVLTSTEMANLNKEHGAASISMGAGESLVFLLPAYGGNKMSGRLAYTRVFTSAVTTYNVLYSNDTSSGIDGTWSSAYGGAPTVTIANTAPDPITRYTDFGHGYVYMNSIDIHGVQFQFPSACTVKALHLHGFYRGGATGASGSQPWLMIKDNTTGFANGDNNIVDVGDFTRGTTQLVRNQYDFTGSVFRLENQSTTLTANNVVLTFEALDATNVAEHQLRYNGGSWVSSVTIPSIAPTADTAFPGNSGTIEIRRVISNGAPLGTWVYRMRYTVGSWT